MNGTRLVLLLAALAVTGCGFRPARIFESTADIDVREVGRSLSCNTPGDGARVQLLPDLQSALDWQASRGITLAGPESLAQAPYVVVEMGMRPTGGYGLAVSRHAVLRGELVTLDATFVSPAPGSLRTQALSTPCVLVQLPPGRYQTVQVQDQIGAVRAAGGLTPPAPAAVPAQPTTLPADAVPPPAPQPAPAPSGTPQPGAA